jgi:PKD repeat protein
VKDSMNATAHVSKNLQVLAVSKNIATTFTYAPQTPSNGTIVTFAANTSGGIQPYSYMWNLGDGIILTGQTIQHVYRNAGTYNVTLTSIDKESHAAATSKTVSVTGHTIQTTPPCMVCSTGQSRLWIILVGGATAIMILAGVTSTFIKRHKRLR